MVGQNNGNQLQSQLHDLSKKSNYWYNYFNTFFFTIFILYSLRVNSMIFEGKNSQDFSFEIPMHFIMAHQIHKN